MKSENKIALGVSIVMTVMTAVLAILNFTGLVPMQWYWIVSPFWIGFGFGFVILALIMVGVIMVGVVEMIAEMLDDLFG